MRLVPWYGVLLVVLLPSGAAFAETLSGQHVAQVSVASAADGGNMVITIKNNTLTGGQNLGASCFTAADQVYNLIVTKSDPQYRELLALATISRVSKVPFKASYKIGGNPCNLTAFSLTP